MSGDPGMIGESSLEKRLQESIRRIDERIESERDLTNEKFAHSKSVTEGNDKRYEQRFIAQEEASKYQRENQNEFRGSLEDVGKRQMPRTEAEAMFKAISDKAEAGFKANAEKVDALQARMDRNEGRSGGFSSGWGYLVAAIGVIATLVSIAAAIIVLSRR